MFYSIASVPQNRKIKFQRIFTSISLFKDKNKMFVTMASMTVIFDFLPTQKPSHHLACGNSVHLHITLIFQSPFFFLSTIVPLSFCGAAVPLFNFFLSLRVWFRVEKLEERETAPKCKRDTRDFCPPKAGTRVFRCWLKWGLIGAYFLFFSFLSFAAPPEPSSFDALSCASIRMHCRTEEKLTSSKKKSHRR